MPSPADSVRIYESDDYFTDNYSGYLDSTEIHIRNFKQYIVPFIPLVQPDASIAEIGSGSGAFIRCLNNYGYTNITGYELNRSALRKAKENGIDIRPQHELYLQNSSRIDLLCMFDVIEHVPNPAEFLNKLKDVLAPGGYLAISTSDNRSLVSRVLGRMWWFMLPPEHCIIYTRNAMKTLLQRSGFNVIDIISINCHFTSIANIISKMIQKIPFKEQPSILRRLNSSCLNKAYLPIYHFSDFLIIARYTVKS
jgi:SAM-dependent methyltransferase